MKKIGIFAFLLLLGVLVVEVKQYCEKAEVMQIIASSFETITQTETIEPIKLDNCVDEKDFKPAGNETSNNFVNLCQQGTSDTEAWPCV